MTAPITFTITDVGRAAAISADGLGLRLTITHAALGTGSYEPQASQTALIGRTEKVSVTNIAGTAPAATARLAASFPALPAGGQVYQAFELGLYAGDPDAGGVLFAVYSKNDPVDPVVVRGAFDYMIAIGLTLSGVPTGSITVQIDPDAAPFLLLLGEHDRDPDAHATLARKADLSVQGYTSGVTTGSGSEYSLAVAVPPASLARFARVQCMVHATNTGAATLAVASLLPRAIKVYGPDGTKMSPEYGRMAAGMLADMEFDGTDWVLLNPIPAPVMTSIRLANVTLSPVQTGGEGTAESPLLVPEASSAPGVSNAAVVTVTISGLRPGEVAMVADLSDVANGARFSLGSIAARVANGAGIVTLPVTFTDAPTSTSGQAHMLDLTINGLRIRHRRVIASTATISAPVITAPAANATGVAPQPSINAGAFVVTGGQSSHVSTDWQISMSPTFDSLFTQSAADTVNKTSWTPSALAFATTFYVRAKFNGTASSSSWSAPVKFSTHPQPAVSQPSVIYPASGATGIAVQPRFTSSAFGVTNATDTHKWSDWQISTTADFASVQASATNSTTDLTAWTPPALSYTTTYYVRVRHTATGLGAGAWSVPVQFTTGASTPIVATPTITSPAAQATGVKGPFVSSAFNLASGSDSHASSDWQISATTTFSALVASTSGNVSSKTSWTPAGSLPRGTYYVRVRHNGVAAGASAWSQPVQFTWLVSTKPSITSPANNATNVDQGLVITSGLFASSGTDRHIQSDWQISTAADFSTITALANSSPTNLIAWAPPGLAESTRYYVRVRHNGEAGGLSDWSNAVTFVTAAATGVTWSGNVTNGAGVLRGVAFGGTKLVAVGSSTIGAHGTGAIITSSDAGLTWPDIVEVIDGKRIGTPYSVTYTGSRWVAIGYDIDGGFANGASYVSTDAVTWAEYSTGPGLLRDIAWDGTRLLGVGMSASLAPVLKSSTDGQTWTDGVSLSAQCGALLTVEWAPQLGLWIAGGITTALTESAGAILTSPDRVTWTRCTLPADVGVINKIVWNGSMAVAVGMTSAASLGAGVVLTSVDGRNWVRRSLLCGALYAAEWALSKWVVGGYTRAGTESAGEVWTSADGVSWVSRATNSGRLIALCQASAPGAAGPVIGVGFTTAGVTSAGGVYRS